MVERREQRLAELVRLADKLAHDARPARACLLEYLRLAGNDDLLRMLRDQRLCDTVLRRVAETVGDPVEVVRLVLWKFFPDLYDFTDAYAADLQFYKSEPQLGREAVGYLKERFPAPDVAYVLCGMLCSWHPRTMAASDGMIIEGGDSEEEDDRFYRAIVGYLVSQGMAFGSDVEVLAASFYGGWPSWDEFWDRYHGWGEH